MRWSPQLAAFLAAAEHGSFREGARRLGISAAAVSKNIARLEEALGVRLFERTSRRVLLTAEGRMLLEHGTRALDELAAAEARIGRSRASPTGTLRLSISPVFAPWLVGPLRRLRDRHPGLQVEIRVQDRVVDLAVEDVDVAIRSGALPDSMLIARQLPPLAWALVASPDYLARHGVPEHPDQLHDHACLRFVMPDGTLGDWMLRPRPGAPPERRDVPSTLILDDGLVLVTCAVAGLGLALVFRATVQDPLSDGRLVSVMEGYLADDKPLHALMLESRRRHPRVRALIEVLSP